MVERKDGGPAFPTENFVPYPGGGGAGQHVINGGMSLRDWFAGQALAGIMASPACLDGSFERTPSIAAKAAWTYADAMLNAREGGSNAE